MNDTAATLRAIFLRPAARLPVRRVDEATAIAGVGLTGDHAVGGRRQVTVLSFEAWQAACAALGVRVDPAARRANLLVAGIDLRACRGRALHIGDVVVDLLGEARPCELLDDGDRVGLCASLRPEGRGGALRHRAGRWAPEGRRRHRAGRRLICTILPHPHAH